MTEAQSLIPNRSGRAAARLARRKAALHPAKSFRGKLGSSVARGAHHKRSRDHSAISQPPPSAR